MSSQIEQKILSSLAYFNYTDAFKCLILGKQPRLSVDSLTAINTAVGAGASPQKICVLHVPSGATGDGYQLLKVADYYEPVAAEGTALTEKGAAVIMQTADCPTVILTDTQTGKVVVTHAGRAALTPKCKERSPNCDFTVIENAYAFLGAKDPTKVTVLVIGDICGECFKHDYESAQHLVAPFLPLGKEVFADIETGSLSLFSVIKKRLMFIGVAESTIHHYQDCTFEKNRYASHRRDEDVNERNHIVVVRRK